MLHLIRRDFALALAFILFGLLFTAGVFPRVRPIQVLLPLAAGVAAGVAIGRGLWLHHVAG